MRSRFKLLFAAALLLPIATGCVVTQTRSGYQLGFIDPGTTLQQFPSANGHVRIRRSLEGEYSLRFSDKLTVYRMGRYNSVRLVQTQHVPGKTAALLEFHGTNNCRSYELLTITSGHVDSHRINLGCQTELEAGADGDRMVIREVSDDLRRYWVWSSTGVVGARETWDDRPEIAHPSNPHHRQRLREQETAARQARRSAQAPPATRTASRPGASRQAVPRSTPIKVPTGSIEAEVITPTRIILVGDGS